MTLAEGKALLNSTHSAYEGALKEFAFKLEKDEPGLKLEFGEVVSRHSQMITTLNSVIEELHRDINFYKDVGARKDILSDVMSLVDASLNFWKMYANLVEKRQFPEITRASRAYDSVQRFLNTFTEDEAKADDYRNRMAPFGIDLLQKTDKMEEPVKEEPAMEEPVKEESDNTNNGGGGQPDNNNDGRRRAVSIWIGAVSITVVIVILLTKENMPAQLASILQALFAIGCGGLAGGLIGTFTISVRVGPQISAAGGFGIAVLVYLYAPEQAFNKFQTFVELTDSDGIPIPMSQPLLMQVDGPDKEGYLVEGRYLFTNLSSDHFGTPTDLYFDCNPCDWVFEETKKRIISIKPGHQEIRLKIIKNPADSTTTFNGYVIDSQTNDPLDGVNIEALISQGLTLNTTSNKGYFSFVLRKSNHPESLVWLRLKKDGYDSLRDRFAIDPAHRRDIPLSRR